MPTWIEGSIKIRGKSKDLRQFFSEGLEASMGFASLKTDFIDCDDGVGHYIAIKNEPHIQGTRRAFIQDCSVEWDESFATLVMPIKQAWAFIANDGDARAWAEISKKFNLDIRLYGFECGMEFCEEVEVIKGEITAHKEIKYDDWDWECPMPRMGG